MTTKKTILFFVLFFLISIPIYWFIRVIPVAKFNQYYSEAPKIVNNLIAKVYPEDLIIDINQGQISVNKETPYCLVFDENQKIGVIFDEDANLDDFINTKGTIYTEICNPIALVGDSYVVYPDSESEIEGAYKIQQVPADLTYQLTKQKIDNFASQVMPTILNIAQKVYYFAPFVAFIFILPSLLMINLWYALVGLMVFKITKIGSDISYKRAYSKTFFALFLWTFFNLVLIHFVLNDLMGIKFGIMFPFSGTLIVVGVAVFLEVIYFSKKQGKNIDISYSKEPEEESTVETERSTQLAKGEPLVQKPPTQNQK